MPHPRVHLNPPALEVRVEGGPVTGELVTLETEVLFLFLGAFQNNAPRVSACPAAAARAIRPGEMFQELFELRIAFKGRLKG